MTDLPLLLFGCAVSFIAIAGAYAALREGFLSHERKARDPLPEADRRPAEMAASKRR